MRFSAAATRGPLTPVAPARTTNIAFLQYTGGTTGVAKGAMLTRTKNTSLRTCCRP
ncbi:AMP-binding protein [Paraburkholderia dipogonis]|uniref:AMP-binding protein n=1 Tax=Paraburkholderia dipogonis TaxID=1211383 RepID=UPI0035ECCF76